MSHDPRGVRATPVTTLSYRAYDWILDVNDDTKDTTIYSSGKTLDGQTVMIRIEEFQPYVYMELPSNRKWTNASARDLYDEIVDRMGEMAPVSYKMCRKFMIEYKRHSTHLMLSFKSHNACKLLEYKCKRKIGSYAPDTFKVHEQNIDPLIKFMTLRKITPCGWIDVRRSESDSVDNEGFSSADIAMVVKWNEVYPSDAYEDEMPPMNVASFDIECYSKNHNSKHPDATVPENIVFQISFHLLNTKTNDVELNLLSLYDCPQIEGATVHNYASEKNLLLGFAAMVNEKDPDVFLSWNGIKFDWDYLVQRAELNGIYLRFAAIGRLVGERAVLQSARWHSSAYGEQKYRFLHPHGRINIDMMIEVERSYKLDKYSLNFVANHFLGEQKEDVSPLQLFKLIEITQKTKGMTNVNDVHQLVARLVGRDAYKGVVKTAKDAILSASTKTELSSAIKMCIHLIGTYCVKDSILPIKLYEHHNTYTTLEQMSNICGVPITYLQTRGQQIKVIAQLYRETSFNNIVVTYKAYGDSKDDRKYQGATVLEAIPGYYTNVSVFDFESLYPTTMIAKNICYTTLVHPSDPIPDDRCNVCEWEDHVGCEHDTKHRKRDNDKILCDEKPQKYRFIKVTYDKDGTPHGEGVFPKLLRKLLTSRKAVKKEIKALSTSMRECTDEVLVLHMKHKLGVLDAKQRALKVSANSMYGFTGARHGMLPFIEGAASTTAIGRELIASAIDYIKETQKNVSIVYGDTDSCMWQVFDTKNMAEVFSLSKTIAKLTTDHLKRQLLGFGDKKLTSSQQMEYDATPINLEFENVYSKYLLLTMKRYIGDVCDVTGKVVSHTSKGVVSVRRDNCNYARNVYKETVNDIFSGMSKENVMGNVYERLHNIARGLVSPKMLSIFVGVGDVGVGEEGETDAEKYGGYNKNSHDVHVMLARRMIARGDTVVPNTRLEYVLLKTDEGECLQGNKAEDYTYYMDNRRALDLQIDSLFYLEKKFNQLNELVTIKFRPKSEIYTPLAERIMEKVREMDSADEVDSIVRLGSMYKRVKFILQSPKADGDEHADLIELCNQWHAEYVMERLNKQFGGHKAIDRRKVGKEVLYDSNPINAVYRVHKAYSLVVKQLNGMFSPFADEESI
uniref:DNA-directed DNA polymerase n=1 Tax=viral metagenome TaxID=1070528 RepID=A0A6C0LZ52_9ZZZZ